WSHAVSRGRRPGRFFAKSLTAPRVSSEALPARHRAAGACTEQALNYRGTLVGARRGIQACAIDEGVSRALSRGSWPLRLSDMAGAVSGLYKPTDGSGDQSRLHREQWNRKYSILDHLS